MSFGHTLNSRAGIHTLEKPKKERSKTNSRVKVPETVVLAMRHMHEMERAHYTKVYEAFPQYSKEYIQAVLSYRIRSFLLLPKDKA